MANTLSWILLYFMVYIWDSQASAPVAKNLPASVNLNEDCGTTMTLFTTIASDADGDPITFSLTVSPATSVFSVNSDGHVIYDGSTLDRVTIPQYTLTITVTAGGETVVGDLTVTITSSSADNRPYWLHSPTERNPLVEVSVREHSPAGTVVYKAVAADPEGLLVDYYNYWETPSSAIMNGGVECFEFDESAGELKVANAACFDYNDLVTPGDTGPHLEQWIEAYDGVMTTSYDYDILLAVTFLRNIPPVIHNLPDSVTLTEAQFAEEVISNVNATDNENDPLTYTVVADVTDAPFSIDSTNGSVYVTANPLFDRASTSSYILTISVSDGFNMVSSTLTVNIVVPPTTTTTTTIPPLVVNLPSSVDIREDITPPVTIFTINATGNGPIQYNIIDMAPAGPFFLNYSDGVIIVNEDSVLDYEAVFTYNITINVNDSTTMDIFNLSINLIDVNEPPRFLQYNQSIQIEEEQSIGFTIPLSITANDEDVGDSLYYWISQQTNATYFNLRNSPDVGLELADRIDFDDNTIPRVYHLEVYVNDSGGLTDKLHVYINITNVNDNSPKWVPDTYNKTIEKSQSIAAEIMQINLAIDEDDDDCLLSYTISGTNSESFTLNSDGLLSMSSNMEFTPGDLMILVLTATDCGSPSRSGNATISLGIKNETVTTEMTSIEMTSTEMTSIETTNTASQTTTSDTNSLVSHPEEGYIYSYTTRQTASTNIINENSSSTSISIGENNDVSTTGISIGENNDMYNSTIGISISEGTDNSANTNEIHENVGPATATIPTVTTELRNMNSSKQVETMETSSVAWVSGVVVGVLLVAVALIVGSILYTKKRNQKREKKQLDNNEMDDTESFYEEKQTANKTGTPLKTFDFRYNKTPPNEGIISLTDLPPSIPPRKMQYTDEPETPHLTPTQSVKHLKTSSIDSIVRSKRILDGYNDATNSTSQSRESTQDMLTVPETYTMPNSTIPVALSGSNISMSVGSLKSERSITSSVDASSGYETEDKTNGYVI
ncbi:unnamed protein product [Owenia fusiformis]|uniref:Uncharacterized protein n=1 Tax=Owenia fusiformis TaxID=6347 RepID=A0A8J1XWU8_OWEFU|nr:unnamed protein product [Owenia fusiformis]